MSFPDLRAFIDQLRRANDLVTVEAPVDPRLEVAEIHRRVIAAGGPALLFTNVIGSDFRLVTNLFGTARRAEIAFGHRPMQLVRRIVQLADELLPPSAAGLWSARDVGFELLKIGSRRVGHGPVVESMTSDVRLDRLPVLTCWPEDGGPFITLPLVYTTHPDRRGHNLGMYRMQVHGPRTAGMHWQIGKGGGFHYAVAEGRGQLLPATVFLGGPPALILSAVAPLPENVPELLLASLIAGERVPQVHGHGAHPLIATAEFALVGDVPPHVRKPEGPFGDHYGYYSLQHDYPVFEVRRIAHRADAIFPATVVGKPRQEDFFVGDLLQELLSPLFPLVMPAVERLWSVRRDGVPLAGGSGRQATIQTGGDGERVPHSRRRAAFADEVSARYGSPCRRARFQSDAGTCARPDEHRNRPVCLFEPVDGHARLHGARCQRGIQGRMAWPRRTRARTAARVHRRPCRQESPTFAYFVEGASWLELRAMRPSPTRPRVLRASVAFEDWPLIVITDDVKRAAASTMNFLWTTFTRFEPAADIHAAERRIVRNHIAYRGPIVIDARLKPGFPKELSCRDDIAQLVTRRWKEYFPGATVEMGDSERAHLD